MPQSQIEEDILDYLSSDGPANKRFIRRALAQQWEVRISYSMVEPLLEKLCKEGVLSTERSGSMVRYDVSFEWKRDSSTGKGSVNA
ncbi:BlaI/MecI/CopY family transcriptional regulator [Haloarcula onubensis]|uniref:BlaI/MecI/CopY family transcriptional regulator n=1 Tax=Haloarcula onubensis TaxID=2950539 RepID=A0ABU2FMU7_9EURY|nr:BlaI/MecI/CopY family transcriptional regulator [Halomicroarcula sp. S3CR25-11]MDS0281511.1 BlaI/MecI/CopY family transcriptional regulator [Halomicroarcula sp. S3CR25-11]